MSSSKTVHSSIDNVLCFSIKDIEKLQELYAFPVTALRNAESEIDRQMEYIYNLESTIAIIEGERNQYRSERDFYKSLLVD